MEFKKTASIYEQIARSIQENILHEIWKADDRIPSVRETAGDNQVNPNTVMRTYSLLQDDGIIYNKRGIGFFVSIDALPKIKAMKKKVFTEELLPELFKNINQLDISWEDLQNQYKAWKEKIKNKK